MIVNFNDYIDFNYSGYGFLLYKSNMMKEYGINVEERLTLKNEMFWSFIFNIGQHIKNNSKSLLEGFVYLNNKQIKIEDKLMCQFELTESGKRLFESKGLSFKNNSIKLPLVDVMNIFGSEMYMGNSDFPYTNNNEIEILI